MPDHDPTSLQGSLGSAGRPGARVRVSVQWFLPSAAIVKRLRLWQRPALTPKLLENICWAAPQNRMNSRIDFLYRLSILLFCFHLVDF